MKKLIITGATSTNQPNEALAFCPSLHGLTATQADLAFLMPRIDHNRTLRETPRQGDWAAVLACDPFGSETAFFSQLNALGYTGVTNWPSAILLDGAIQQSMSTAPATPALEYAYLQRASAHGFRTMAFFRSLPQARAALDAGLETLVLHPGLLEVGDVSAGSLVRNALERLIETIKKEAPKVTLWAYTSLEHEKYLSLSQLSTAGLISYETSE